jgi:hypothetical protein
MIYHVSSHQTLVFLINSLQLSLHLSIKFSVSFHYKFKRELEDVLKAFLVTSKPQKPNP